MTFKELVENNRVFKAAHPCVHGAADRANAPYTVIDESKTDVMSVISDYQKKGKLLDIKLEEISTEEVIKKIYENETNERKKISGIDKSRDNTGIAV